MIVVSDTSPLNDLILIDAVEVLPKLFDRIVAPPAVVQELQHLAAPPKVRGWAQNLPTWLEVVAPQVSDMTLRVGPGEADAIRVAIELNADAVLMDDRNGRKAAARRGIQSVSLITVLDLAALHRLINVAKCVAGLRTTNYRCPTVILDDLLRRHSGP